MYKSDIFDPFHDPDGGKSDKQRYDSDYLGEYWFGKVFDYDTNKQVKDVKENVSTKDIRDIKAMLDNTDVIKYTIPKDTLERVNQKMRSYILSNDKREYELNIDEKLGPDEENMRTILSQISGDSRKTLEEIGRATAILFKDRPEGKYEHTIVLDGREIRIKYSKY